MLLAAFVVLGPPAGARVPTTLELDARSRARGNDMPGAVALATVLLARPWAAQITRVRIERAGRHAAAGLVLSGVKLRRHVDPQAFLQEANEIADLALRSSDVEEVDLWTTIPLDAGAGVVTSGDYAKPTSRTVFTLTVRRENARSRETYWDPRWRAQLAAGAFVR